MNTPDSKLIRQFYKEAPDCPRCNVYRTLCYCCPQKVWNEFKAWKESKMLNDTQHKLQMQNAYIRSEETVNITTAILLAFITFILGFTIGAGTYYQSFQKEKKVESYHRGNEKHN